MQSANNFVVLNIREYLENEDKRLGEDKLVQLLSEFSCPLNMDVEHFLKQQAIEFAKRHQAVTYLVLSLEAAIRQTQILQYQAGGMVAFVEADDKKKLLSFYENYGFKRFDTRQTVSREAEVHELIQLLRLL